jgi:hypothetical protein
MFRLRIDESIKYIMSINITHTKLNLSDNKIGPEGAASIAHSLLTNTHRTKFM